MIPIAPPTTALRALLSLPVIVASLGYFVDVYDLLLFNVVRVPSLVDLGLSEAQVSTIGARVYNWQQAGLLIGGFFWGILGDKLGRRSVLFGSIIMYSVANIVCGFVTSVDMYAFLRFVAGQEGAFQVLHVYAPFQIKHRHLDLAGGRENGAADSGSALRIVKWT